MHPEREASTSLVPVQEIEAELEQKWYTLEERAQDEIMGDHDEQARAQFEESKGSPEMQPMTSSSNINPFRMLHKKEKDP